jgi:hypothetical protein
VLSKLVESVEFYSSIYGPYPFNAVGAIVDSAKVVGYSLETQTKPNFPVRPERGDARARDLAHVVRRLGDADGVARHLAARGLRHLVGVDLERVPGNKSAAQWFKQLTARPRRTRRSGTAAGGTPGTPACLFNGTIYYRGGMTLQALREKVGDFAFSGSCATGRRRTATAT